MDSITFLGYIASLLTTVSFLPQLIRIAYGWKYKRHFQKHVHRVGYGCGSLVYLWMPKTGSTDHSRKRSHVHFYFRHSLF